MLKAYCFLPLHKHLFKRHDFYYNAATAIYLVLQQRIGRISTTSIIQEVQFYALK